jgi:hypothetical protein
MTSSPEGRLGRPEREPEYRWRLAARALALLSLGGAIALAVLLLRGPPGHPSAETSLPHGQELFLRTCQALEAERLVEAQASLARLHTLFPGRPELRILDRLIAHRHQPSTRSWGQAFLEAWAELGRPNLHESPLLPPAPWEQPLELNPRLVRHASTPAAWLTLTLALHPSPEELARWLLQQPPEQVEPALALALLEPGALESFPGTVRAELESLLRQSLSLLARAAPRAIQPPLTLLLSGTRPDTPLSRQELETLDALSTLRTWRAHSFSQTFSQVRGYLEEVGAPAPGYWAFTLVESTVGARTALLLERRAESSWEHLPVDEQRWLGRTLWRIGQRLAESSSHLEHSMGTSLMELGSYHLGQRRDLLDHLERRGTSIEHLRLATGAALERWPLPSLLDELQSSRARHERTFLRALAGHASLP